MDTWTCSCGGLAHTADCWREQFCHGYIPCPSCSAKDARIALLEKEERKAWEKENLRMKEALPRLPDGWLKDAYNAHLAADAVIKRCEDVEGMAKVLYETMNPGLIYELSSIKGMWTAQARAVSAWLKEG